MGAEYCDQLVCLSMCLSLCEHISGKTRPIFTKCFVQMPCDRGSVLLWRRCDTLCILSVIWMTSRLAVVGRVAMRGRLNLWPMGLLPLAELRYRGGVWCQWIPCFTFYRDVKH